ncbi:MAG TPA: hypothetical protein VFE13_04110 [Caulobacteraceae bacterium]|jgi:hypothetical protein|nr:hypothetical protein [Caulobacteraceae bacterium]
MNGRRTKYSGQAAVAALILATATAPALAAPSPQPEASGVTASALAEAAKPLETPTFASIPPAPKDVRPFTAWRAAIADTKAVGRQAYAEGEAGPWLLADSEAWATRERAEAVPPAPMTTPAEANTDAFVREMIRRATPPPRARH